MHNSANLIKCQLWGSEMIICRRVADYRRLPRREHSTHPYFWAQEEPNGASERGAEWPRYGGCVVATARTHARSWRKKHRAAGTGLGTAFTHHKGLASTPLRSFSQESPNYLQKVGRHTHKKISRRNGGGGYSSCHSALRKAATRPLRSAGLPQFSTNCAIPPATLM